MNDLEQRLFAFLRLQPTAEAIDDLPMPSTAPKRADFLLAGRAIVVEVKSLSNDPSHKVESTLEPHRDRPQYPLYYGEVDVAKVVAHLPDGDQIMKQLAQRLTRSVKGGFRDADEQIASTKAIFDIPDADGVLVLINEGVEILSPEMIAWQLTQMLQKRGPDDRLLYPNVNLIWVLSEAHRLDHPDGSGVKLLPMLIMPSEDRPPTARTEALVDALQPAWAASNNLPFVDLGEGEADEFVWRNAPDGAENDAGLAQTDAWQRAYRKAPYLRNHSDRDLLAHGAKVVAEFQRFIVHEPGAAKPARLASKEPDQCSELSKCWADFIEEMNHRAIDMRELARFQGRLP